MKRLYLPETKKALAVYDQTKHEFERIHVLRVTTDNEVLAELTHMEELREAVGIAFGMDTMDRNSMETCKNCVRPSPWLREQVKKYGTKPKRKKGAKNENSDSRIV